MSGLRRRPRLRAALLAAVGVAVLAGVVATVGGAPFLRGLLAVTPASAAAALLLGAVAASGAAWRWTAVAHRLGLPLTGPGAVAAVYRAQLLNTVLPGGIVGDVHRAWWHGRDADDARDAARAVATERVAGQLVQLVVVGAVAIAAGAVGAVVALGWVAGAVVVAAGVAIGAIALSRRGRGMLRREAAALGRALGTLRTAAVVVVASLLVAGATGALFVVACLAVGVRAPLPPLVLVAAIAMLAAALPVNVGGWGPREAASASAFALLGLPAATGVAASAAFGVLAAISVLPGAVVLAAARPRRARIRKERTA